jgi:hypothetical protein
MPTNPLNLEEIKGLMAAATDVSEADLMRYEHGGGRWAKLRDGERTLVADFYNEADREAHVAVWLAAPTLIEQYERNEWQPIETAQLPAFDAKRWYSLSARRQAIEECARVAEGYTTAGIRAGEAWAAGQKIAAAIRARSALTQQEETNGYRS